MIESKAKDIMTKARTRLCRSPQQLGYDANRIG